MPRSQSSSYKFQFFIMDVTLPQNYQATHCYISLVSDQFEEILTRKCKVVDGVSDIETTLKPKMVLCLNRRSSEYRSPFVKLQVYICSSNNPSSHLVVGSLTFDLLEELVNPNHREIREQLAGTDVRIRLSISNYACQDQLNETKLLSSSTFTNSVLQDIENLENPRNQFQNKVETQGNFMKEKQRVQVRHSVIPAIDFADAECLDFSEILPDTNLSKLNDSTSFECHRNYKDQLAKLSEQLQSLKDENKGLLDQNEELRQINQDLEDVNARLTKDLRDSDQKTIRLEKQLGIYQQRVSSADVMKMEMLSKSQSDQKNLEEIEIRNKEIMKYVYELQENQLKLNCTITDREHEIEELRTKITNSDDSQSLGDLSGTISSFNRLMSEWSKEMESSHQREVRTLIKGLKRKESTGQSRGKISVEQELRRTLLELTQLKKQYLFKSEISVISLVCSKLQLLLDII